MPNESKTYMGKSYMGNGWGELSAKNETLLAASKCAALDIQGLIDTDNPQEHLQLTFDELTKAIWAFDPSWVEETLFNGLLSHESIIELNKSME